MITSSSRLLTNGWPELAIGCTRAKTKLPTQQYAQRSADWNHGGMPNEDVRSLEIRTV